MIVVGYALGVCYALVCLALSLICYRLGMPKKYTRKLVHILVGFEWVILYHFMGAGIHFLAVCILFLIVLFIAYRKKLMPMISSDGENAPGTVYYAVAMTGAAAVALFVPDIMLPFGIGVMCTSLGDGLAGVIGQLLHRISPKIYNEKTLLGALSSFIFSFLSALAISRIYGADLSVVYCLLIALLSCELELFTGYGLDNISITWGVTAFAWGLMYYDAVTLNYILPIIITPAIVAFAHKKKALTVGGIVIAVLLDLIISLSLGNFGFAVLCAFFAGSLIVDKVKRKIKSSREIVDEGKKGECRDVMQVLANGGVAAVMAAGYLVFENEVLIVGFLAALSEAFADTVASGVGIASKNTVDPFRLRRCERGLSGGMSLLGTSASLVGALLISLLGLCFGVLSFELCMLSALCAFLGGVFDSFLGSVAQAKNKCTVCGKITERNEHCDEPTRHLSGLRFVDNDIVNLSSGVFASALAITICFLIF